MSNHFLEKYAIENEKQAYSNPNIVNQLKRLRMQHNVYNSDYLEQQQFEESELFITYLKDKWTFLDFCCQLFANKFQIQKQHQCSPNLRRSPQYPKVQFVLCVKYQELEIVPLKVVINYLKSYLTAKLDFFIKVREKEYTQHNYQLAERRQIIENGKKWKTKCENFNFIRHIVSQIVKRS